MLVYSSLDQSLFSLCLDVAIDNLGKKMWAGEPGEEASW